jgi:hypothetical protein
MRRDNGVRQKLMGGGMSTARKDMRSGYYPSDMGMAGGAMYKKGGSVKKKNKVTKIEKTSLSQ